MQDYETLKSYELIPKQKRIIFRRILISDYKCWQIQIVVELSIDFTNRNAASKKIMLKIWDGLYCSKLVILILVQRPCRLTRCTGCCAELRMLKRKCISIFLMFHCLEVQDFLSCLVGLLNNICKITLMCTRHLCLVSQILWGLS